MSNTQDSGMKKFLKQVGNIVAVQAVASAATELGKTFWPRVKSKLNVVLDKADEINKAKKARQDLKDLVKNTGAHYKQVKEERLAQEAVVLDPESDQDPTEESKTNP